jgi:hypothetical protein
MATATCTVEGCDRARAGRHGRCAQHHKFGDDHQIKPQGGGRSLCSANGCSRLVSRNGLCRQHAQFGPEHKIQDRKSYPPGTLCAVEGCGQPRRHRDWCSAHHSQWRRTGEVRPFHYKWATERRCVVCGCSDFERRGRKFCSGACQQMFQRWGTERLHVRACAACGVDIDLPERGKAGRRRRSDTLLCRHCRQINRSPRSVSWLAVRDGATCGICGDDVDMTLRAPVLMRPSVDHIIPRARGGSNEDDNLQLAHLLCNQRKQGRLQEEMSPSG